jgi:hypothetical protein
MRHEAGMYAAPLQALMVTEASDTWGFGRLGAWVKLTFRRSRSFDLGHPRGVEGVSARRRTSRRAQSQDLADQAWHAMNRMMDNIGLDRKGTAHHARAALKRMDNSMKSATHALTESFAKR